MHLTESAWTWRAQAIIPFARGPFARGPLTGEASTRGGNCARQAALSKFSALSGLAGWLCRRASPCCRLDPALDGAFRFVCQAHHLLNAGDVLGADDDIGIQVMIAVTFGGAQKETKPDAFCQIRERVVAERACCWRYLNRLQAGPGIALIPEEPYDPQFTGVELDPTAKHVFEGRVAELGTTDDHQGKEDRQRKRYLLDGDRAQCQNNDQKRQKGHQRQYWMHAAWNFEQGIGTFLRHVRWSGENPERR